MKRTIFFILIAILFLSATAAPAEETAAEKDVTTMPLNTDIGTTVRGRWRRCYRFCYYKKVKYCKKYGYYKYGRCLKYAYYRLKLCAFYKCKPKRKYH